MADQGFVTVSQSWSVPREADGVRVDLFVRRCLPHLSRQQARRAIEEGAFWVGGRPARKGDRLATGSVLSLRGFPWLLAQGPIPAGDLEVPILYEDECLLALDKPAGLATHGFSGRQTQTVANYLAAVRPSVVGVGGNRWEAGLVHRLDRDTSGILLAAKDQPTFSRLRAEFGRGAVHKIYWALVSGQVRSERIIDTPLIHDPRDRRMMRPLEEPGKGKTRRRQWRASTRFRSLGYAGGFSLVEVEIGTGVTHQIRVHLSSVGHPLVGDPLYGSEPCDPFGLGRLFLHARELRFRHPRTAQELVLDSPLAMELDELVRRLRLKF